MKITAYLSYRENDLELEEIDLLNDACLKAKVPIELKWSENSLGDGDSFIDFMKDDMGGARFLIFFCSPEYFRTAYTLYEFIQATELVEAGLKLHLAPVRVTKEMTLKDITNIRETILNDASIEAEIEELARLLGKQWTRESDAEIRRNILLAVEKGWKECVVPALETILPTLQSSENVKASLKGFYQQIAEKIVSQYAAHIARTEERVHTIVQENVNELLIQTSALKTAIKKELKNPDLADEDVAPALLTKEKLSVEDSIYIVSAALSKVENICSSSEWSEAVRTAKQMAGWLVLLSVNNTWLVHNEHNACIGGRSRLRLELIKKERPYAEVIISRTALQPAMFKLSNKGQAIPTRYEDQVFVLDAGEEGIKAQVLTPIYKDLLKATVGPSDEQEFQEDIVDAVGGNYKTTKMPVYYLILCDTYKLIAEKTWFTDFMQKVSGKLIFIEIDVEGNNTDQNCCKEEIKDILQAVAQIYRKERD